MSPTLLETRRPLFLHILRRRKLALELQNGPGTRENPTQESTGRYRPPTKHQSCCFHNDSMALSQHTSRPIPAHVIAAYSDTELDQYLDEHRRGEVTDVNVEDWENLPESFIQRLR